MNTHEHAEGLFAVLLLQGNEQEIYVYMYWAVRSSRWRAVRRPWLVRGTKVISWLYITPCLACIYFSAAAAKDTIHLAKSLTSSPHNISDLLSWSGNYPDGVACRGLQSTPSVEWSFRGSRSALRHFWVCSLSFPPCVYGGWARRGERSWKVLNCWISFFRNCRFWALVGRNRWPRLLLSFWCGRRNISCSRPCSLVSCSRRTQSTVKRHVDNPVVSPLYTVEYAEREREKKHHIIREYE